MCGCSDKPLSLEDTPHYTPTDCEGTPCTTTISTACIFQPGYGLPCLGIPPNATLEQILQTINNILNQLGDGQLTVMEDGVTISSSTTVLNFVSDVFSLTAVGLNQVNVEFNASFIGDLDDVGTTFYITAVDWLSGISSDWSGNEPVEINNLDWLSNIVDSTYVATFDPVTQLWRPFPLLSIIGTLITPSIISDEPATQGIQRHTQGVIFGSTPITTTLKNLYSHDGTLISQRTVTMGDFDLRIWSNGPSHQGLGNLMLGPHRIPRTQNSNTGAGIGAGFVNRLLDIGYNSPGDSQIRFWGTPTPSGGERARIAFYDTEPEGVLRINALGNIEIRTAICSTINPTPSSIILDATNNGPSGSALKLPDQNCSGASGNGLIISRSCLQIGITDAINNVAYARVNSEHGLYFSYLQGAPSAYNPHKESDASTFSFYMRESTTAVGEGAFAWAIGPDPTNPQASELVMRIKNSGQIKFHKYGSGTFTGTATGMLSTTSIGDVIESDANDVKKLLVEIPAANAASTLVLTDAHVGQLILSSAAVSTTVDLNSSTTFPVGGRVEICQYGTGAILVSATGVTLRSRGGLVSTNGQYAVIVIHKIGATEYLISGDRV